MPRIVGVRLKPKGKIYYFNAGGKKLKNGTKIVVEAKGCLECGEVVLEKCDLKDKLIINSAKNVVRIATEQDLNKIEQNRVKIVKAKKKFNKKTKEHGLQMKLIDAEYSLDSRKIVFYFSSENRVDFRNLVKDLAAELRIRIELRQIGIRDEAKLIGGFGICGKPFCCSTFLSEFQPVSIKMAKEQGMSLNPVKISGACGRLMCCLKYEEEAYLEILTSMPQIGEKVKTPNGNGVVVELIPLSGKVKVNIQDAQGEVLTQNFGTKEISVLGSK